MNIRIRWDVVIALVAFAVLIIWAALYILDVVLPEPVPCNVINACEPARGTDPYGRYGVGGEF